MWRLGDIDFSSFNPAEAEAYRTVEATKFNAKGPTGIMLRSPILAEQAIGIGRFIRFETSIPGPLRELAILMAARSLNCDYVWNSHRRDAEREGLAPNIIDAIAAGMTPDFTDETEELVFLATKQLTLNHNLDDEIYQRCASALGEKMMVELISTIGYYTMLALLVSSFRSPLPEGYVSAFKAEAVPA